MQNSDTFRVPVHPGMDADVSDVEKTPQSETSRPICIGVFLKSPEQAETLLNKLRQSIRFIPVVKILPCFAEIDVHLRKDIYLVTDLMPVELTQHGGISAFAGVIVLGDDKDDSTAEYIQLAADDQLAENIAFTLMSQFFAVRDAAQLSLKAQHDQLLDFVEHIGKELSIFYHNINNPLTILSGNIQLLQLMADSIDISDDLLKPISDIATVSSRFQTDLQSIAALKEKIRAGNLQKEEV